MKTYLGDSVYAEWDGFHVVIYTDNGNGPNMVDKIYLDSHVLLALSEFIERTTIGEKDGTV